MRIAAFLFFLIPIVEMIILIEVGSTIGVLLTIGLVVLTAVGGVWLLRMEGLATLTRVQEKLQRGELPETELLEGIMLLVGGALLLTPGFATDFAGFVCLLPGLRRPLAARIIRSSVFGRMHVNSNFSSSFRSGAENGTTIDGEFQAQTHKEIDKETDQKPEGLDSDRSD